MLSRSCDMSAFIRRFKALSQGQRDCVFFVLALFALVAVQYGLQHLVFAGLTVGVAAAVTTTNPVDAADRIQTLFNRKTLRKIEPNLILAQYGQNQGYKTIGTTIRFYRPRKANLAGINAEAVTLTIVPLITPTAMTEGTAPTNKTEVKIGYVDISLGQRGGISTITDKMEAIDLLNTVEVYSDSLGGDCALDYDTVCRNTLINGVFGSNGTYSSATLGTNDGGYFERFAGVLNTGASAADFASLSGLTKAQGCLTRAAALGAITQLKTSKIPKLRGTYPAIASPQVIHDMRRDPDWMKAATFKGDPFFKDEDLTVDGVTYINANNPWVEAGVYGTESATDPGDGLIYATLFLGAESFGLPNLSNTRAGGSQQAPKITILNNADKSDPLNQTTVLSWKSFFGAGPFICASRTNEIGDVPRYVVLRSKSTFV
jgi:N4-gp56 family major capsid protein